MKTIILAIIVIRITLVTNAQHVNIPDTAFLYALIDEGVDTSGDSLISYSEAEAVISLNVSGEWRCNQDSCWGYGSITSLKGIESFVILDTLKCSGNQLTSLDVSHNNALEYLECAGNKLTSLDVSNNLDLEILSCGAMEIYNLDVSNNLQLKILNCGYSQLTNLDVSSNVELQTLGLRNSLLTNLDVSSNTLLEILDCGGNQLTSLDVSNNTALTYINCGENQLTSLDVSGCTALTRLGCGWGNQLTSLDVSNNMKLEHLDLYYMPSLNEVCVWEGFNEDSLLIETDNSPNVCFQTDCNGDCSIVGIEESCQEGISIYPNPTYDLLTIETITSDLITVEINSLSGKIVLSKEMQGTSPQLNLSSFPKGVYLITIRSKDFVTTRKIIKL